MGNNYAAAQTELERLVADVEGSIGVAAWPVGKPEEAFGVNMDVIYPTASTFKIPELYALYQMVDKGEVNLADRIEITPAHRTPGSGVLQDLDFGLNPTIRDLAVLMTVLSDNQATDMLYAIIGTERIHTALDALGLTKTRVPLDTRGLLYDYVGMDRNNPEHTYEMSLERMRKGEYNMNSVAWSDVEGGGNDVTTPREMTAMCEAIEQGVGLSESSRNDVLDIMKRQKLNERIPGGLPENVVVAHKTGSLKGVRNDAGIVYAPAGPYVIGLFSKQLKDEAGGVRKLQQASRIVWNALSGAESGNA